MTTQPARYGSGADSDEAFVAQFLERDPAFFERHPQILARLQLPHRRGHATVSLVERQIEVLRDQRVAAERQLAEYVAIARANDQLAEKVHRLARRLVRAVDLHAVLNEIDAALREDFGVFHARLALLGVPFDAERLTNLAFARAVSHDDPALRGFESLFSSGKPRCGQIRDSQREWLFEREASEVASVALVPLGTKGSLGLLALASPDRDRFHPGMSTDLLARMAELIGDAIDARRR
ncbi:MAG: DUF484 family protein [Steroidobacteraceae bacterium]|nr:DUF484 family protein [Steroidobacteraceae bacterium]MDW8258961.1 DUF484 family protein [Gammaproteobacteria bacterium]